MFKQIICFKRVNNLNNVLDQSFFFRFWKEDVNFFCFAGCSLIFQEEKEEYLTVMKFWIIVSTKNRRVGDFNIIKLFISGNLKIYWNPSKYFEIALKDPPLVLANFRWRGGVFYNSILWCMFRQKWDEYLPDSKAQNLT